MSYSKHSDKKLKGFVYYYELSNLVKECFVAFVRRRKRLYTGFWCESQQLTILSPEKNGECLLMKICLVKGKGIHYQEIINKTKRKLKKKKIKGYINGSY